MGELDFDELDRAVNSLMQNGQTATASTDDTNSDAAQSDQTTAVPSVQPSTSAPLAVKRRGRFMDVVHPSSDMTTNLAPKQPVRQVVNITPDNNNIQPEPLELENNLSDGRSVTYSESEPDSSSMGEAMPMSTVDQPSQPETHENVWPDPIDFASTVNTASEPSPAEPGASTDNQSVTDEPADEKLPETSSDIPANDTDEPGAVKPTISQEDLPSSPFLPDTKVEKRPLGSPAPAELPIELPSEASASESPTVGENEPLPEEYSSGVEAVEAAEKPTPSIDSESEHEPSTASKVTSIPQQYVEKSSTNQEPSGAIYDTDSYHQALAHPAKKHSGWWTVLWIVLMLAVGAAAAVVYFLYFAAG